ncbi:MAG: DUF4422 domain-containing protein [Fusobacteriaceae bacterium]|jgi:hypothetical protein|nr:DUF4422 domain-containing protein [Fusobacteriaceae bacterium]
MNVKILVATHKKYNIPNNDIYMPLHVGKEGKEDLGYVGDNTGDNISDKNPYFCELTGLYWAWKNLKCNYIGLVHYRRHFSNSNYFTIYFSKNKYNLFLKSNDIYNILKSYDIILPKKRNYCIETVYDHYKHSHFEKDMLEVKNIINEKYPQYIDNFNKVMNGKNLHLFNMFICKKEYFDEYCSWIFGILFEVEKRIDISQYDVYQSRIYGFLGERLFNVWINNKKLKIYECNIINIEKINWIKKIVKFLKNKIEMKLWGKKF